MVSRPVEDEALRNIERDEKLLHEVRIARLNTADFIILSEDRQGWSVFQIAARYGLSRSYVAKRLKLLGYALILSEKGYKGLING